MGLKYKIANFLSGRYMRNDKLNITLLVLCLVISLINSIFFGSTILNFISAIPMVLYILRMFSKEIYKRSAEEQKFEVMWNKIAGFFKLEFRKIKEIKTHRYIKCKSCKTVIRVPRKTGKHTLSCPKCGERQEVNIRF